MENYVVFASWNGLTTVAYVARLVNNRGTYAATPGGGNVYVYRFVVDGAVVCLH